MLCDHMNMFPVKNRKKISNTDEQICETGGKSPCLLQTIKL